MRNIARHSLRDQAAERLRTAIESGALSAGTSLKEVTLAAELGVSRTPTREALVQLVKEGYVVSEPGRGFRVAPVSVEDGVQVERLIAVLEQLALEDSPPESTDDLEALRKIQKRFRAASGVARQLEFDDRWHTLLLERCENQWTLRFLDQLRGHLRRYNRMYIAAPDRHERSAQEHEEILDALENGDRVRAGQLLEAHWRGGIARAAASARETELARGTESSRTESTP